MQPCVAAGRLVTLSLPGATGQFLILYRITLVFLAPVLAVFFLLRWMRSKETRSGLAERLGLGRAPPHPGKLIWVHGASLGELTAARPLLDTILARDPAVRILVTMNTYTARQMVGGWKNPRLEARMAPLDYRLIHWRHCKMWSPVALIVLENELWPNRLSVCRALGIPILIAGGRMSERALSMWSRLRSLSNTVTSAVTYLAPVDQTSAARFQQLGLDPGRIGPAVLLKSTVALPEPNPAELAEWGTRFDPALTVLAASTHDGEDAPILRAFSAARAVRPELRMILAPRHPERAPAIARLLSDQSLAYRQRSAPEPDKDGWVVLLADTLGEMALWYRLAGITLVGGTWVDKGGHTPFEPAQFGSAIVHGPSVHNHAQAFEQMDKNGGAVLAKDEPEITQAILDLCDADRRAATAAAATQTLAPLRAEQDLVSQFVDRLAQLAHI